MSTAIDLRGRVVGCVLGGAVGDALGAPYEGMWSRSIPRTAELLSGYAEFEGFCRGQYTDDTQLTIATLKSVVRIGGIDPADIARSIAKLWRSQEVIGPGGACTSAADRLLAGEHWTRCGAPIGQAGNGAAMRTAPIGLYFVGKREELHETVAQISRITHQDPRAVAGGVAVASTARLLAVEPGIGNEALCRQVAQEITAIDSSFAELVAGLPAQMRSDGETVLHYIAWSGGQQKEFGEVIITPYVIPTVLAALWAVASYPGSWEKAVGAAIGLGGDVDTLGAIVGGLMGARLGEAAIPDHLLASVADSLRLRKLALKYASLIEQSNL